MIAGRQVQINWKLGLFTLIMLPVLINLGFWQLSREQEKRELLNTYEQRMGGVPVSLDQARSLEDPAFVAVRVTGEFDNERYFLLDNRTHEGRPGYEVITPLVTSEGDTVLVNRGWVQQGPYRSELPALEPVSGRHEVVGNIYVPSGEQVMLGEEGAFPGWPWRIQRIDVPRMYEALEVAPQDRALAHTLRLQENEAGVLLRNWQAINITPATHRGYAVQWFSMALALTVLFLLASFPKQKQSADHDRPHSDDQG